MTWCFSSEDACQTLSLKEFASHADGEEIELKYQWLLFGAVPYVIWWVGREQVAGPSGSDEHQEDSHGEEEDRGYADAGVGGASNGGDAENTGAALLAGHECPVDEQLTSRPLGYYPSLTYPRVYL